MMPLKLRHQQHQDSNHLGIGQMVFAQSAQDRGVNRFVQLGSPSRGHGLRFLRSSSRCRVSNDMPLNRSLLYLAWQVREQQRPTRCRRVSANLPPQTTHCLCSP